MESVLELAYPVSRMVSALGSKAASLRPLPSLRSATGRSNCMVTFPSAKAIDVAEMAFDDSTTSDVDLPCNSYSFTEPAMPITASEPTIDPSDEKPTEIHPAVRSATTAIFRASPSRVQCTV